LCEAGGVALIAVSRLALLAEAAGGDGMVHAVLDAGRGEFYYGAYEGGVCLRESLLNGDEVVAAVGAAAGTVIACEGKVAEALVGADVRLVDEPLAEAAVGIALRRLARGDVDDVVLVDANYLRRTDFEIKAKLALRAVELGGGAAG
jgi:tRNA threonylcarbamoyladenosine biosynthesis protein TsaB